jgi:hypothetical protein
MPQYHLHVVKGRKKVDPRTVELPNDESAKRHAKQLAAGLTTLIREFGIQLLDNCHVEVTDAKGKWIGQGDVSLGSTPGRSRVQQRLRA